MRITVTQEHIDLGRRMRSKRCPIALAMRDAGLTKPRVLMSNVSWRVESGERLVRAMPMSAQQFRRIFDSYGQGQPFTFDLDVEP